MTALAIPPICQILPCWQPKLSRTCKPPSSRIHGRPASTRLLVFDEQADGPAGCTQIIEALCRMFRCQPLDTFQLDYEYILDEKISEIFPDTFAFVGNRKGNLSLHPDAPKTEFSKQSTLIDLLQEPGTQGIGDLKHSTQHAFSQRIEVME